MNRNRNLVIDFQINHKHDHFINHPDDKHVQPSFVVQGVKNGVGTMKATKKKRKFS